MRPALVLLAALALGCDGGHGTAYTLRITPSPAALTADRLAVNLVRSDSHDTATSKVQLPSPTPTVPWTLDLNTHSWGGVGLAVTAEAERGGVVVARGTATPVGTFVDVTLADVALDDGGTPADLAADLGCNSLLTFGAQADTVLYQSLPSANYGANAVLQLTASSVALLRFNVSSLPTTATVASARLVLRDVPTSNACGALCTACAAKEMAGTMQAYFATSDWVETEATWTVRRNLTPWAGSGASGFLDRSSMPIATANHVVGSDVSFDLMSSVGPTFSGWRNAGNLSVAVVTSSGIMFTSTRDTTAEGCNPLVAAQLEVRFCN